MVMFSHNGSDELLVQEFILLMVSTLDKICNLFHFNIGVGC